MKDESSRLEKITNLENKKTIKQKFKESFDFHKHPYMHAAYMVLGATLVGAGIGAVAGMLAGVSNPIPELGMIESMKGAAYEGAIGGAVGLGSVIGGLSLIFADDEAHPSFYIGYGPSNGYMDF